MNFNRCMLPNCHHPVLIMSNFASRRRFTSVATYGIRSPIGQIPIRTGSHQYSARFERHGRSIARKIRFPRIAIDELHDDVVWATR